MSAKGRPLTPVERTLLDAFLAHDFEGVEALRVQAQGVLATKGCSCGCGTIGLVPVGDRLPRSEAESPVPTEGDVLDADGRSVGGLLLFVDDGLLSALEIYSYDHPPLPLPPVNRVAWTR